MSKEKEKDKRQESHEDEWETGEVNCGVCAGAGKVDGKTCYNCNGSGTITINIRRKK